MRISQMKHVLAIVEHGTFSQAAKKLFISQPSLSESIINLEKSLGVVLFDRSSSPVRLTPAGELYARTAARIIDLGQDLQRELSDVGDKPQGRLSVGSSQFVTAYIMPHILTSLQNKFPDIQVTLVESLGREREEATLKGAIDLFFTTSFDRSEQLEYVTAMQERILLALPPNHPFNSPEARERQEQVILPAIKQSPYPLAALPADRDFPHLELARLRNEGFVMLRPNLTLHKLAVEMCRQCGFTPNILLESQSIDATRSMAIAGLGNSFIPETLVRYSDYYRHPIYYQIDPFLPARTLEIAFRRNRYRSRAMQEFIRTTHEVLSAPVVSLQSI